MKLDKSEHVVFAALMIFVAAVCLVVALLAPWPW